MTPWISTEALAKRIDAAYERGLSYGKFPCDEALLNSGPTAAGSVMGEHLAEIKAEQIRVQVALDKARRRREIAAAVLTRIAVSRPLLSHDHAADEAVLYADALLGRLAETPEPEPEREEQDASEQR